LFILYFMSLMQEPEPVPPPSREQQLQAEIEEAVFSVQQGFESIGRHLRAAQVEADKNQVAPLLNKLETAHQSAEELLANMEALLALLPETESEGKGGGQASATPQPKNPLDGDDPAGQTPAPADPQPIAPPHSASQIPPIPAGSALFAIPPAGAGWGALPPRLQATLQNATLEDMPLRYRGWLKHFHRQKRRP